MNFSELFKQSGQICSFSPDGKYVANAVQYRLVIRDIKTLQILQLFTCLDAIQKIEWSSDSQFVLCGMFKRSLVQVWSLEQPEWRCKVDEGSAGLIDVCWSPDGRHLLTTADFHLRITIWSLVSKTVSYIKYPKACSKGIDFSAGGKYLALAERRDCKDCISIFVCSTWQLVKHFETDTEDLAGVRWSSNGLIAVWESSLCYKLLIYTPDGRCQSTYSAYDQALGIKTVSWSPSCQFLAVGSFDQKVRLINNVTWKAVAELFHTAVLETKVSVTYKEVANPPAGDEKDKRPVYSAPSKYEVVEGPVQVPVVKPDVNKANPKVGVSAASFSANSRYMYTRNDNQPTALWVWDVEKLSLSTLLLQQFPIRGVEWDPCQCRLALCTGTNKVYMWSPAGCLSVEIPAEASFVVNSVSWHKSGNALLLTSMDHMCVCFLSDAGITD